MYILNFQRTGVDSVIDTLNLKKENLQKSKSKISLVRKCILF